MCTSNSKQKTPNPEQRWHLWTYPTVVPRWSENLCAPEINRRRIFPCATFLSGAEIRAKEGKWLEGFLRRELATCAQGSRILAAPGVPISRSRIASREN